MKTRLHHKMVLTFKLCKIYPNCPVQINEKCNFHKGFLMTQLWKPPEGQHKTDVGM